MLSHDEDPVVAEFDRTSRREFVADVGRLASAVALAACVTPLPAHALASPTDHSSTSPGDWDLSWVDRLSAASDRAVFDWPGIGDPADPIVLEIAERYLDNCEAAYGSKRYDARVVLNIRTQAVPIALSDAAWERFALGVEYNVKDPFTQAPAARNPFWHRAPDPAPGVRLPTLADLVQRGAVVLVCDLALGRLATRLAAKTARHPDDVHRELRSSFIPAAVSVPSGIFGLAKAQNAGCALVRI
jgi:hypothetical protein